MRPALSFLLAFAVCFAVPTAFAAEPPGSQSVDHGVGFSLSLDYGTCSVYFANGSAIDVAKIEGSTSYEAAMRHIQATDEVYHPETPVALDTFLLRLQHYLPTRPFLRSALNIWHHQGPDAAAVRAMLLALKSAAESYLETPVPVADLVIP